jgi:hypothetical protein
MDKRDEIELQRFKRACTAQNHGEFNELADYNPGYKTWEIHQTANMGMAIKNSYRFFTEEGRDRAQEHVRALQENELRAWGLE